MSVLSEDSPFYPIAPERVFLETDSAVAFYDAYPISKGHALVVPKVPVVSVFEFDSDLQAAIWETVRLTREFLEDEFHPDGFNIGINDGQAAGQTIPHAHIHIIPRYKGDCFDPRGGIRWIMPEKAKYWETGGESEETRTVIGIDVGVKKGLHVVQLTLSDSSLGNFTVLGNGVSADEAVALCRLHQRVGIGIDSPPCLAQEAGGRKGERELMSCGIQLFVTPANQEKLKSRFYEWMTVGFELFASLANDYPLYQGGAVAGHAMEVYPYATEVVLAGRKRPSEVTKTTWRRQILAEQGYDIAVLPNADCVDAALAAVTMAYAVSGDFSACGDPTEGCIVLPRRDAMSILQRSAGD